MSFLGGPQGLPQPNSQCSRLVGMQISGVERIRQNFFALFFANKTGTRKPFQTLSEKPLQTRRTNISASARIVRITCWFWKMTGPS